MPLLFGPCCVLRVTWAPDFLFHQKKKCVLVSSFVRVTRSPCHQFVGALFSALLGMLSDFPFPPSLLSRSFSCLVALLRLRCSRSGPRSALVQLGSEAFSSFFQFFALPLLGTALQLFSGSAPIFLTQVDRLLFQGFF